MSKRDRQAVEQGLNNVFGGADLLDNIIQRDRTRRRTLKSPSSNATAPANVESTSVSSQPDHMTDKHYDNMASKPADKQASMQADMLASGQTDHVTDRHYDNMTSKPADKQVSMQADMLAGGPTDNDIIRDAPAPNKQKPKRKQTGSTLVEARIHEARQLASSPKVNVTLRLPTRMNRWLDEYMHGTWLLPVRVRKQELVAEALRMLIARRGRPGEPIVKTELLDEESEP